MPYKDREKRIEWARKFRLNCPERVKKYNQKHTKTEKFKLNQKKWKELHREQVNAITRKYLRSLRIKMFDLLGQDKCVRCGFSDKRALQFDHINGGGVKERKSFGRDNNMLCHYLRDPELARKTFQVLCANCNWIKKHDNNEVTKRRIYPKAI